MTRNKSILMATAAMLTAAGLLLGGYLVTNAMLNAAWAAGDGQHIMGPAATPTATNPAQTAPSDQTSESPTQPILLTITDRLTITDLSLGQPGAEDISPNGAAQIMARSVRDYFDENVEGSTVDGLIFIESIANLYIGGASESGSSVAQGPTSRPTWRATITTPAGTSYGITIDAVTGQVFSVYQASQIPSVNVSVNPDTGQGSPQVDIVPSSATATCSAPGTGLAEAVLYMPASLAALDFVTNKTGHPASSTQVVALLPSAIQVAVPAYDAGTYIVTVNDQNTVTGFSVFPNGIPADFSGCNPNS